MPGRRVPRGTRPVQGPVARRAGLRPARLPPRRDTDGGRRPERAQGARPGAELARGLGPAPRGRSAGPLRAARPRLHPAPPRDAGPPGRIGRLRRGGGAAQVLPGGPSGRRAGDPPHRPGDRPGLAGRRGRGHDAAPVPAEAGDRAGGLPEAGVVVRGRHADRARRPRGAPCAEQWLRGQRHRRGAQQRRRGDHDRPRRPGADRGAAARGAGGDRAGRRGRGGRSRLPAGRDDHLPGPVPPQPDPVRGGRRRGADRLAVVGGRGHARRGRRGAPAAGLHGRHARSGGAGPLLRHRAGPRQDRGRAEAAGRAVGGGPAGPVGAGAGAHLEPELGRRGPGHRQGEGGRPDGGRRERGAAVPGGHRPCVHGPAGGGTRRHRRDPGTGRAGGSRRPAPPHRADGRVGPRRDGRQSGQARGGAAGRGLDPAGGGVDDRPGRGAAEGAHRRRARGPGAHRPSPSDPRHDPVPGGARRGPRGVRGPDEGEPGAVRSRGARQCAAGGHRTPLSGDRGAGLRGRSR